MLTFSQSHFLHYNRTLTPSRARETASMTIFVLPKQLELPTASGRAQFRTLALPVLQNSHLLFVEERSGACMTISVMR